MEYKERNGIDYGDILVISNFAMIVFGDHIFSVFLNKFQHCFMNAWCRVELFRGFFPTAWGTLTSALHCAKPDYAGILHAGILDHTYNIFVTAFFSLKIFF